VLAKEAVRYNVFDYIECFNIRPKSYECVIKVRSEKHREVLKREIVEAERVVGKFTLFSEETRWIRISK
jgi:hypothetical protein